MQRKAANKLIALLTLPWYGHSYCWSNSIENWIRAKESFPWASNKYHLPLISSNVWLLRFYSRLKFESIFSLCQTLLWRILTCLDFFTSQAYMQASVPCYSKFHGVRNWLTRFIWYEMLNTECIFKRICAFFFLNCLQFIVNIWNFNTKCFF